VADLLAALLFALGIVGAALGRHDPALLTASLMALTVAVLHAHAHHPDDPDDDP
jgi:hypothetical protein